MGLLEGIRCVWGRKGGWVMGFLEGIRCVGGRKGRGHGVSRRHTVCGGP